MNQIRTAAVMTFLVLAFTACGLNADRTNTSVVLTSIEITPPASSIAKGTTQQFNATGTYSDNSTSDITALVSWKSADTGVATVSDHGLLSGLSVGAIVISASSGDVSGTCSLTVTNAALISIAVSPPSPTISFGAPHQFTATGTFSDNTTQELTTSVTWSSSDASIATVSNAAGTSGKITSLAAGTTMITALSGAVSGSTTLTVAPTLIGGSIQGNTLNLAGSVTTFAGALPGSADGTAATARFYGPAGIAVAGTNIYVADASGSIRKIVASTGEVTTVGGSPNRPGVNDGSWAVSYLPPFGMTTDGTNLYYVDIVKNGIQKIVIATGEATLLAGSTTQQYGATDGIGSAANFRWPLGITTDGTNVYVADTENNTIRKIVISTGLVTTLAGSPDMIVMGSSDGIGAAASFNRPSGITTDGTNLYVTDRGNNKIRKIAISTGEVTTLAGSGNSGFTDGQGIAASFNSPVGIATDGANLYVADSGNRTVRKIVISSGQVTTVAGAGGSLGSSDGQGSEARFIVPYGIAIDGSNLYITDKANNTIRKIAISTMQVSTLAGTAVQGSIDGTGPTARFAIPSGITTDGSNLYVTDSWNNTVRRIVIQTGAVTTLAGSPGLSDSTDGTGSSAHFNFTSGLMSGITTDGINLYVTDTNNSTIRKIVIATGAVTTLAGSPGITGTSDGTGSTARFNLPSGITTDGTFLYVTDCANETIRKIVISTGAVTTVAGTMNISGSTDGVGSAALFICPHGITTDGTNLYIVDFATIRKMVIATGEVKTIAGSSNSGSGDWVDGVGTAARFSYPLDITTDGTNLYVADSGNSVIRKITISTGKVSTLAGGYPMSGAIDGTGLGAWFFFPQGITTDGTSLYVADSENFSIRKIQ